jgi:hypothetical protein
MFEAQTPALDRYPIPSSIHSKRSSCPSAQKVYPVAADKALKAANQTKGVVTKAARCSDVELEDLKEPAYVIPVLGISGG